MEAMLEAPFLLVKSIGLAALDATLSPGALQPWVDEVNRKVVSKGKYTQLEVLYFPLSPPPVFWDYKCKKCRWWEGGTGLDGRCKVVEGHISPIGWCAIWVPQVERKAGGWIMELLKGDW